MMVERGMSNTSAHRVADELMASPELIADLMMTYELEMHDMRQVSPAMDGLVTFLSFVSFGVIPLVPYILREPTGSTFILSVISTFLALTGLGLLRWWSTKERILRCVGETILVGSACALVAFAVGMIVG